MNHKIMILMVFLAVLPMPIYAYSGSAIVDGHSYEVQKVYSYSNGIESATPLKYDRASKISVQLLYKLVMPEMTVKTPVATRCVWNKANEDRKCFQTVQIDYTGADLALKEAFGASVDFKNLVIKTPDVLKKGSYNITYEFDYPANKGEEWNLTFSTPLVNFLIDPTISACTILNTSGETYLLTADILEEEVDSYCMDFEGNDITLDCQGHLIDGVGAGLGIYCGNNFWNMTIKNCELTNWNNWCLDLEGVNPLNSSAYVFNVSCHDGDGINLYYINATLENVSSFNNGVGLSIGDDFTTSCVKANISYSKFYNNSNENVRINDPVDGFCTPEHEVYFYNDFFNDTSGTNFIFYDNDDNKIFNISKQVGTRIYSAGTEIGGNYWTNSTSNGYSDTCADDDEDGFCDAPYDVEANSACIASATCGNNTDYFPLSNKYICKQNWNCTDWSECVRETQTRTCTDDNACGNNTGKPAESQSCFNPIPNASFNVSTSGCCPISLIYCSDNMTKSQLWNTSEGTSWASVSCRYGCDNATSDCSPAPFESNLWILGIIFGIIIITALVIKWKRGR